MYLLPTKQHDFLRNSPFQCERTFKNNVLTGTYIVHKAISAMLGAEPTDLWGALDIQSSEKSEKVSIQGETPAPQQPTHTRLLHHLTAVMQTIRQQLHL